MARERLFEDVSASNRWDTYRERESKQKNKSDIDLEIENEADEVRKGLLIAKKERQEQEAKSQIETITAEADKLGIDPVEYYERSRNGEDFSALQQQQQEPSSAIGRVFKSAIDAVRSPFVANPWSKENNVTKIRTQSLKDLDDTQQRLAQSQVELKKRYENSRTDEERAKWSDQIKMVEEQYGVAQQSINELERPSLGEYVAHKPIRGAAEFLIGGVLEPIRKTREMNAFRAELEKADKAREEMQAEYNMTDDTARKKEIARKMSENAAMVAQINQEAPETMDDTRLQNAAAGLIAGFDVATLGIGKAVFKSAKITRNILGKTPTGKLSKSLTEKTLVKMFGEDGLKKVGYKTAQQQLDDQVEKSLTKRIEAIAAKAASSDEFATMASKEIRSSMPKEILKTLGNKNTAAAMANGFGYAAASAVEQGETDGKAILESGIKGMALGYGLERGLTGTLVGSAKFHYNEKEYKQFIQTSLANDRKPSLKERVTQRIDAHKPATLKAYREGRQDVQQRVDTELREAAAERMTKEQEEAASKASKETTRTSTEETGQTKALAVVEQQKVPEQQKMYDAFAALDANDFNVDTAVKNYNTMRIAVQKEIEKAKTPEAKALHGQKLVEINSAIDTIKAYRSEQAKLNTAKAQKAQEIEKVAQEQPTQTPQSLAGRITQKKAEIKDKKINNALAMVTKADTVKDTRTLQRAQERIFDADETLRDAGFGEKEIALMNNTLKDRIRKLKDEKNKAKPTAKIEEMQYGDLKKESARLVKKVEQGSATKEDRQRLNGVNKALVKAREEKKTAKTKKTEKNATPKLSTRVAEKKNTLKQRENTPKEVLNVGKPKSKEEAKSLKDIKTKQAAAKKQATQKKTEEKPKSPQNKPTKKEKAATRTEHDKRLTDAQKAIKAAKTLEERKAAHRAFREARAAIKSQVAKATAKKGKRVETVDFGKPTKAMLKEIEDTMKPDVEYSMVVDGVTIRNMLDLSMVKKSRKDGVSSYSFSQYAEDVAHILRKGYYNLTGKRIDFRVGHLDPDVKGIAKHEYNVARTAEPHDVFTMVHEWTHFVTANKKFDISAIPQEARTEVLSWWKATHKNKTTTLREAIADGIALIVRAPHKADEQLPRLIAALSDHAPKEVKDAIMEAANISNKINDIDPVEAIQALQRDIVKRQENLPVSKMLTNWLTTKILPYADATSPLLSKRMIAAERRRIRFNINHGGTNPYFLGTLMPTRKFVGRGERISEEIFSKLKKYTKLPDDYKCYEEIQIDIYEKLKDTPRFKGLSESKAKEQINQIIGDYRLAKHAVERKNLLGIHEFKELEKKLADEAARRMEREYPWVKDANKMVSKWWKQSTKSISERYADVLTKNQRFILENGLGYENYVPIDRRERGSIGAFKLSKGGTGAIYPAMENFATKLDKIMHDCSIAQAKSDFIKAAKRAVQRGDKPFAEDVTTTVAKETREGYYEAADKVMGLTMEEVSQAKLNNTLGKALKGVTDAHESDAFLPDNMIHAVVDGKQGLYIVDPMFAKMLKNQTNPYWSVVLSSFGDRKAMVDKLVERRFADDRTMGKVVGNALFALSSAFSTSVRTARFGIIHSPVFIVNNLQRDFFDSLVRTDKSMTAYTGAYMVDTIQRAVRFGTLGRYTPSSKQTREIIELVDYLFDLSRMRSSLKMSTIGTFGEKHRRGAFNKRYNKGINLEKVADIVSDAFSITETRARKTTLRLAIESELKKGVKLDGINPERLIDMLQKTNEISVDWSAHGSLSRAASLAPFGRATLTGTAADIQILIENPRRYILRSAMTVFPLTLGVYSFNNRNSEVREVWDSLTDRQKSTYWFFILGKRSNGEYAVFKVAKPKIFAATTVTSMEYTFDRLKEVDPETGYTVINALYDSAWNWGISSATNSMAMDYSAQLNPLVQTAVEAKMNKKLYWGTDIVSPYYKEKTPLDQQNEFTTWYGKMLGRLTNQSPMMIDNLIKNVGGTLASQAITGSAEVYGGTPLSGLKRFAKMEFYKDATMVNEPVGYASNDVKTFYEEFDDMSKKYNSIDNMSLANSVKIKKYQSAYGAQKARLSEYYDKIAAVRARKNLTDREKKEEIRKINKQMTEEIRRFNKTKIRNEFLREGKKMRVESK